MPPTKTKTKKPTIDDRQREVCLTKAALLNAEADVLDLQERKEKAAIERSGVTVKAVGSRTEAVKLLEKFDRELASLECSLTLATGAVAELEVDHQEAVDALEAGEARLAEEAERREREQHRRKLLAAEDALQEARNKLAELPGRPGDRIRRRIATILGPWFPPNHRPVIPEPPLAERR
jgi:hypothetical protein